MKTEVMLTRSNEGINTQTLESHIPDIRMSFALSCIDRWAAVACVPDGETLTGHPKLRLATNEELVERSISLAKLLFDRGMDEGLMLKVPKFDEAVEILKIKEI